MKKLFLGAMMLLSFGAWAQKKAKVDPATAQINANKEAALNALNTAYDADKKTALQIWDFAEVGYKEVKSAALHIQHLRDAGFTVETGVAGIPTAFVATYGSGSPSIGILAEYDALPGLSQTAGLTEKAPIQGRNAGHGCGHHLFGTASVSAGIAIKDLIAAGKLKGTIKVYGTPAEEGGSGKVFLVRAGLLNDLDAVIHWHPDDANAVTTTSALANKSAKFKFYGISAHAAGAPEQGRSSLDAVEAMNNMVNMMREHIPQETRIHYVITSGGKAPNVVPDFAEVYYYVRHPKRKDVVEIFDRVMKAAEGAALGTGTTMKYDIIGGTHDLLINRTLAELMQTNLERVGGVTYTEEEKAYAKKMQPSFLGTIPGIETAGMIKPISYVDEGGRGSTDVGDVSYAKPTVGLRAATWVPGTPAHSWQAVSSGGTEIGTKGMLVASKTMALTAIDLMSNPEFIKKATEEFNKTIGDYKYKALLGDIKPALNYRD
jgi:aminobenzoyl-glutamate utilization protein B